MSEKVLGFYEKDALRFPIGICNYAHVEEDKLVPVNLKSESVTIEWLEKEIERLKKKSTGGVNSEYARAWDDGYGSAMRDVISITKGEQAKKQAGK